MTTLGLAEVLRRVAADLERFGCRFAVVGGFAVSVRTEPRFTRDVDLAVAVGSDDEAERLIAQLRAAGYEPAVLVEQDERHRFATVRLRPVWSAHTLVDLLFASSGIEAEVVRDADRTELAREIVLPVATVPCLLALKVLSRNDKTRPQDAADLFQLAKIATPHEWERALELAGLIESRGYARGRDLCGPLLSLRADEALHG